MIEIKWHVWFYKSNKCTGGKWVSFAEREHEKTNGKCLYCEWVYSDTTPCDHEYFITHPNGTIVTFSKCSKCLEPNPAEPAADHPQYRREYLRETTIDTLHKDPKRFRGHIRNCHAWRYENYERCSCYHHFSIGNVQMVPEAVNPIEAPFVCRLSDWDL